MSWEREIQRHHPEALAKHHSLALQIVHPPHPFDLAWWSQLLNQHNQINRWGGRVKVSSITLLCNPLPPFSKKLFNILRVCLGEFILSAILGTKTIQGSTLESKMGPGGKRSNILKCAQLPINIPICSTPNNSYPHLLLHLLQEAINGGSWFFHGNSVI